MLEPPSRSALVHVGRVESREDLELALRALDKTRKFWQDEARLIVVKDERRQELPIPDEPGCSFSTPAQLRAVFDRYLADGCVLSTAPNDSFGDATLHALASGVPLTALNYRPWPVDASTRPRHGDAFLIVRRVSAPVIHGH
jgi:glycosyltransferase involved in cell wall biosynthesis